MFGATVLVPMLTGLNPSVALFGAGIGTLIFHNATRHRVPVFLGSSFAYITAIQYISTKYGLEYATGGIVFAGIMYLLFALVVRNMRVETIKELFPPVVTGTMIIVIGLTLAPTVINGNIVNADIGTIGQRWTIAMSVIATMVIVSIYGKGFYKLIPILYGLMVGYIIAGIYGMLDLEAIRTASWLSSPEFMLPKFNLESALLIAPISLVTLMEHIGDITTNGKVVGKDFFENPKLHRTLMGDGLATVFAGMIGAPANTTYSENTGVLAITKVYSPFIIKIASLIAILMAFVGKLGVILQTIPLPIMGGVSIILFGSIASIGIRTLVEGQVDFSKSRNSLIVAVMLVLGISGVTIEFGSASISGLSLVAIVGVLMNRVLPSE